MNNCVAVVATFLVALICRSHGHHGDPLGHQAEAIQAVEYLKTPNDIDDAIIAALENLRSHMTTGDSDLGIPVLDPMHIEHYELDMAVDLFKMNLTLDDTTVTKLSGFVINKIENDLENLSVNFNVTVPEIDFEGQYIAVGGLEDFLNITGNGHYTLSLENLTTWGTVTIGTENGSGDETVSIQKLDLDFHIGALKTGFENLLGGGSMGDLGNDLLTKNGADYLNTMKPGVNGYIADLVTGIADPILSHFTLNQILEFLGVQPN